MKSPLFLIILFLVSGIAIIAQDTLSSKIKTFDVEGLEFNYPSDWIITDKSSSEVQSISISKENASVLIVVSSPREIVLDAQQYSNLQQNAHSTYVAAISKSLSNPDNEAKEEWLCLDFNARKISGTKYSGIYQNEPATGEFYPFALGNRFITLVYMRTNKDSLIGNPVWNDLIKSLTLSGSDNEITTGAFETNSVTAGIINGKAIKLVRPRYLKEFVQSGPSGPVEVRVTIDETGKVISAKGISGNKNLFGEAEYAAKKSKFSPTRICDQGIKVTGVIVYIFAP